MARKGAAHHFAKMSDVKVAEARYRYSQGDISQLDLALEYEIATSTMGRILRGDGWRHVGKVPMARNITVTSDNGWRAAVKFRFVDTGEEVMHYEGIYDKKGTANQRISFWRNAGVRNFWEGPDWDKRNIRRAEFVDGWPENATITWNKAED